VKFALRAFGRGDLGPLPSAANAAKNVASSELEVDKWSISDFVTRTLVPAVGSHPFPLDELMLLVAAVCRFEPREIYEWGTHIGKSARVFFESSNHYGISTEIHSIDLPDDISHPEHPRSERGRLVLGLPRVHLHQGDGLDVSLQLWRSGGRRQGPLFFLDGDHAYGSVLRELNGVMDEIPDAPMLVHDSFFQSPEAEYNIGPHQAIEAALAARPGRYRRIQAGLGLPGLTLLYPSAIRSG
jgi:cephalosporin hydroxylase